MGLKKQFATNKDLENDGVWNEFGDEFRIKIARAGVGNSQYTKELTRIQKKHRATIHLLSTDAERKILQEAYARTVIKGWETKVDGKWVSGIDMDESTLLEVTVENLVRVFHELPDVFNAITKCADDAEVYRQQLLETTAKN